MKYLLMVVVILIVVSLTGCATNPFNVAHLERVSCANGYGTQWANDTEIHKDSIHWHINKTGWKGKQIPEGSDCKTLIMTPEQLAQWNG